MLGIIKLIRGKDGSAAFLPFWQKLGGNDKKEGNIIAVGIGIV